MFHKMTLSLLENVRNMNRRSIKIIIIIKFMEDIFKLIAETLIDEFGRVQFVFFLCCRHISY